MAFTFALKQVTERTYLRTINAVQLRAMLRLNPDLGRRTSLYRSIVGVFRLYKCRKSPKESKQVRKSQNKSERAETSPKEIPY